MPLMNLLHGIGWLGAAESKVRFTGVGYGKQAIAELTCARTKEKTHHIKGLVIEEDKLAIKRHFMLSVDFGQNSINNKLKSQTMPCVSY